MHCFWCALLALTVCACSALVSNNVRPVDTVSRRQCRIFGVTKDLEAMEDFDPNDDDDDDDGTKTKQLLETSLKVLEMAVDSDESDLLDDALLDDGEPVTTRSVTRSVPESQPQRRRKSRLVRFLLQQGNKISKTDSKIDNDADKSAIRGAIDLIQQLLKRGVFKETTLEYANYPRHPEYPGVDLSGAMIMLNGIPPLEYFFSVKKVLRLVRHVNRHMLGTKLVANKVSRAKTAEDGFRALFTKRRLFYIIPNPLNLIPLPEHVYNHWQHDKEVARQFLCGVNPVMISVVQDVEKQLSAPLVNHFGKDQLENLAGSKRLFYVSYDDIAKIEENDNYKNPHLSFPPPLNEAPPQDKPERVQEERFFHAPIVLFVLDQERQELDILGIQLDRDPNAKVYTRENCKPDEWLFVKACLTTADSQMHEWVSHLGKTHLTMEPHIIAIHNTLKKHSHPVYTYVKPLCKDTLFLNWGARRTLARFDKASFGDYMTSVGTGQFMQLIGLYWSRYDFFKSSGLPSELESRGFDQEFDMPCYLYRQDGLKLWDAYGQFATDFVDEVYASDDEVKQDKILQEWAVETTSADRANVPGFPSTFEDKATLAKVLQTLNWITGGLHAAVNFPQYEYFGYAPNKPLHKKGQIPTQKDIENMTREEMFENRMPSLTYAAETLSTVHTLTFQTGHCIDNLSNEFRSVGKQSYEKFLVTLDEIGNDIEKRNKNNRRRRKAIYHYLHPSQVPASIDI